MNPVWYVLCGYLSQIKPDLNTKCLLSADGILIGISYLYHQANSKAPGNDKITTGLEKVSIYYLRVSTNSYLTVNPRNVVNVDIRKPEDFKHI